MFGLLGKNRDKNKHIYLKDIKEQNIRIGDNLWIINGNFDGEILKLPIRKLTEDIEVLEVPKNEKDEHMKQLWDTHPTDKKMSKDIIQFYYWKTNLPLKNLKKYIDFDFKNYYDFNKEYIQPNNYFAIIKKCYKCGEEILYFPTSRENKKSNESLMCERCKDIQRKEIEDEELEKTKQKEEVKKRKQQEINNLKTMPYQEYLQTDHWKKTRKDALKRADYKCQLCGEIHNLNVHHNTYENRGNEKPTDLVVLCRECHAKFHDKVDNDNSIVNMNDLKKDKDNFEEWLKNMYTIYKQFKKIC